MSNHLGDTNKMVSETPISDSTPHNVGDLGMQIRRLERQLNAANDRIKRLEEAGDRLQMLIEEQGWWESVPQEMWRKAKDAK